MNVTLAKIVKWILIIAMPFTLGFGTITGIIAWDYPSFEYPRIPSDTYGWDDKTRLEMATVTVEYLRSREPVDEAIVMIEELRLPEDGVTSLYNEREIGHMHDVKVWSDRLRDIFQVLAIITVVAFVFMLTQSETRPHAYDLLNKGGWATVIILAAIAIFILVAWNLFFTAFHELLFPPGTWTFYYTDSLIRLFPEKFWFDVGVIISVGTLLEGFIMALIGRTLKKAAA